MKKKLEIQTILVLLCVLGIAGAWIGIQVARDSLGVWSERAELHFTTDDLLGLGPRSELRSAGMSVGHVRRVKASIGTDGKAHFELKAGIRNEFATWKFAPVGIVKVGVVQSALAPSSIHLDLSTAPDAVQAIIPGKAQPPVLRLEKEPPKNDLNDVAAQYRKLGDQIDATIRQFTDKQPGRDMSVMQELSQAIPAVAASMHHIGDITSNLSGKTPINPDPTRQSPVDRLFLNLADTTGNLKGMTASLQTSVADGGKVDGALEKLTASLDRLQKLTDQMTTTVANINLKLDGNLKKVDGLLDETTGVMTTLHGKIEGFGNTFVGRMLIAPGEKKTASTAAASAPVATPKPTRRAR